MYYSYIPTPSAGWEPNDTLIFTIPVADSLSLFYINTEIRNTDSYPYKDLWLTVSHNFKDKNQWEVDTIKFILADDEGKRHNQSWSYFYQKQKSIEPVLVRDSGSYCIKVNHLMQNTSIQGIKDIGIKISK